MVFTVNLHGNHWAGFLVFLREGRIEAMDSLRLANGHRHHLADEMKDQLQKLEAFLGAETQFCADCGTQSFMPFPYDMNTWRVHIASVDEVPDQTGNSTHCAMFLYRWVEHRVRNAIFDYTLAEMEHFRELAVLELLEQKPLRKIVAQQLPAAAAGAPVVSSRALGKRKAPPVAEEEEAESPQVSGELSAEGGDASSAQLQEALALVARYPGEELPKLLANHAQKAVAHKKMCACVDADMRKRMDTGIRPNPMLAKVLSTSSSAVHSSSSSSTYTAGILAGDGYGSVSSAKIQDNMMLDEGLCNHVLSIWNQGGAPVGRARQIFGVSTTATAMDIKKAYRSLALRIHPDKNLSHKVRLATPPTVWPSSPGTSMNC